MDDRMRLKRRTDALVRTLDLQRAGDDATDGAELAPFFRERVVAPSRGHVRKQFEMHRRRGRIAREPGFLRRETKHRRKPAYRRAEQMIEHSEACYARN